MYKRNLLLATDSYKPSHYSMFPKETTGFEYIAEPRRSHNNQKIIVMGMHGVLCEYFTNPITKADIDEAEDFWAEHGEPFYRNPFDEIVNKFGGWMPLQFDTLPEGSIIGPNVPVVRITATHDDYAYLPGYFETITVRGNWYPSTVASNAFYEREVLTKYFIMSSDSDPMQLLFKMHDFAGRGVSSGESAAIGGNAHLSVFRGTDTVEAVMYARHYYNERMAGFSIPAAEHGTVISWGRKREFDSYENMIDTYLKPGKMLAIVIDSYDPFNAINNILGGSLREKIITSGGTLVFRPDSGVPEIIVPQILELLWDRFGGHVNSKGYRVLPSYIRMIQGDGINKFSLVKILDAVIAKGFSTENVGFGQGSGKLQEVKRDDFGWAEKPTAVQYNSDEWIGVSKSPVTDTSKKSKAGRYTVQNIDNVLTATERTELNSLSDVLQTVWKNGEFKKTTSLSEIRGRIDPYFQKMF